MTTTDQSSNQESPILGRLAFCVPVTDLTDVDDLVPINIHNMPKTVGFLVYQFERSTKHYISDGVLYESYDAAARKADQENQRLFQVIHR